MLKIEKTEVVGWGPAIRGMRNPMNSWKQSDSFICREEDEMTNEEIEAKCGKCPRDTKTCGIYDKEPHFIVGNNDRGLMAKLRAAGTDHRKFMRMLIVYLDITAPLYWWKEFKTYRAGRKFGDDEPDIINEGYLEYDIEMNSCSTMHKIAAKEFTLSDFSCEHLSGRYDEGLIHPDSPLGQLRETVGWLNQYRDIFINWDSVDDNRKDVFMVHEKKDAWWQMIQLLPSSYNQKRTVMLSYEVLANMYKSRKNHKLDEWHTFCDWIKTLPYSELITGGADYMNKKLTIPESDEIVADTLRKLRNTDGASPDKSKAILLEFYEKMKDASSGLKKDFKIVDEWNSYGHVNCVETKALRDHFDKLAEEGKR